MENSLLPNIYDFLAHTYPFSALSTLTQDTLAAAVKISYYAKEDVLTDDQLTGVGLFMIRTGSCEQINKDGTLRARLGVGDSFGYTQLNKEGPSDYKVIFLENTLIYLLPRQILEFIKARSSTVSRYFDGQEYVRLSTAHNYLHENADYLSTRLQRSAAAACQDNFVACTPNDTLQHCAQQLRDTGSELAVVLDQNELIGVVTKSDLALRAIAEGMPASSPVSAVMTHQAVVIEGSKPLYQVLESMFFHNVQNLPVVDSGKVIGVINTRSLLQTSLLQGLYLVKSASKAQNIEELARLSQQKSEVFITLVQLKVRPRSIQRIMSRIADAFTRRVCALIEKDMGQPPCSFAFFAAGSLARGEVQFLSDQDNGLVYERELNDKESAWFAAYAEKVCKALDRCGYTWCTGNYMACNTQWRGSYARWKQYYAKWIGEPDPQALLNISVFLDLRCEYGDEFLITKLKQDLLQYAAANTRFLALLCSAAVAVSPPLGLFKQFVLTKDGENKPALNIKHQGINLIVELARLYALQAQNPAVSTYDRLETALPDKDAARELTEAYTFLNDMRFNHQYQALQQGHELSNMLPPSELSPFERSHLKDAFRIIARQQSAAQLRFAKGL